MFITKYITNFKSGYMHTKASISHKTFLFIFTKKFWSKLSSSRSLKDKSSANLDFYHTFRAISRVGNFSLLVGCLLICWRAILISPARLRWDIKNETCKNFSPNHSFCKNLQKPSIEMQFSRDSNTKHILSDKNKVC